MYQTEFYRLNDIFFMCLYALALKTFRDIKFYKLLSEVSTYTFALHMDNYQQYNQIRSLIKI